MLSSLRYIRKYSSRYEEEQNAIDAWMNLMGKSFSSSSKYSELLASLPSLLKGYGDTWDVGKKRYKLLLKHVVYPTIDRRIEKDDIKLLSDSLNAALNFQEDEKLNALLKK